MVGPKPFGRFTYRSGGSDGWDHIWEAVKPSHGSMTLGSRGQVYWAHPDVTGAEIEEARAQLRELKHRQEVEW